MKKIPAIILLSILTVSLLAYLFYTPSPPKIPGCMDKTADNYDVTVTVDDSSCIYPGQLSQALQDKVDSLKNSNWDKIAYQNLRTDILNHFDAANKEGSPSEDYALFNLDADYMSVLYKETKKVAKKCFSKSSNLKKEVDSFYKKYKKKNKDVKKANSIFYNRSKIKSFQKKVRSLLKKQYDQKSFLSLQNDISNFKNSSFYKSYIKPCKGLSSDLQKCSDDLSAFYDTDDYYKNTYLPHKKKTPKIIWRATPKGRYDMRFKPYQWYYDQLKIKSK